MVRQGAGMALPSTQRPGVFYVFLVVVAVLPFITTTNLWGWWFVTSAAFLLLAGWLVLRAFSVAGWPPVLKDYRLLLALLIATWLYLLLKLVPLPAEAVGLLSPEAARVFSTMDRLVGIPGSPALGLDRGLGLRGLFQLSGYLALFVLVLVVVTDVRRARLAAYVMATAVGLHGLWGLIDLFGLRLGRGRAEGLFADPNVFAVFIELGLALAVGIYIGVLRRRSTGHRWRSRLVAMIDSLMSSRVLLVGLILVLFTALFASGSRGGALAALTAWGVAGVLFRHSARRSRVMGYAVLLSLLAAASLTWFGGKVVLERMEIPDLGTASRPSIWRSAVRIIDDYPLVGVGAGSWPSAYSRYREPDLGGYWLPTHAHNDYLQLLAEHGIVGYLLLGGFVMLSVARLVAALRVRHDPFIRGLLFGSLAGTLSLLLHSLVDRSFQSFTTAAYFYLILALGLAAARLPREGSELR